MDCSSKLYTKTGSKNADTEEAIVGAALVAEALWAIFDPDGFNKQCPITILTDFILVKAGQDNLKSTKKQQEIHTIYPLFHFHP